jgi:hypothetical protein
MGWACFLPAAAGRLRLQWMVCAREAVRLAK